MSTVTGAFATIDQTFSSDPGAVGYLLTLTETSTGAVLTGQAGLDAVSVSIPLVPPGIYKGHVGLVNASNVEVTPGVDAGDLITVPVTTTITLKVPTSLSLSQA